METKPKQFNKEKKVVIYFLAAFLSIGLGAVAVLYLQGGMNKLSFWAPPILKRLTVAFVIFILTVGIAHCVKEKLHRRIGVVLVILLAVLSAWHISGVREEIALKPQTLQLEQKDFRRYDIDNGHFRVREARPKIIKKIEKTRIDNIKIYFSKPLPQKTLVKVKYKKEMEEKFRYGKKKEVSMKKGSTSVLIPVKGADAVAVKLVLGEKIGNEFDLDRIEINGNYKERIQEKGMRFVMYLAAFLLLPCLFLLFRTGQEFQIKTDQKLPIKILSAPFGFLSILSILLASLATYLVHWVKTTCGDVSFSIIVLQLTSPIKGTDSTIINSIIKSGIIPPFIITITIVLAYLLIVRALHHMGELPVRKIPRWSKIMIEIALVVFLVNTICVQGTNVGMWDYLYSLKQTTTLYEDNYVDPSSVNMTFPEKKRNLIYIYLESMENSYMDEANGGNMNDNYIPNLTKLAKENVSFSNRANKLGGSVCLEATAYTAGGLIAQTAGINLKLENTGSMFGKFLPGLTSLGDILNKEGYKQMFLCGSNGDFAGRDTYFKTHKDYQIEDYNSAIEEGDIPSDYRVFWGHEDEILYKRAKKHLKKMAEDGQPFNFTMLTVDTHYPKGYKCRLCKNQYEYQYANVISCADQQVYDFVNWIKQQDFFENTTIIIAGDHTTMVDTADPFWTNLDDDYKRTVYNVIINPGCSYKKEVTRKRNFSTMDMFPTTLAALGVQIDGNRLGLGTNLFSGEKTLPEKYGVKYLNTELKKNDKEYNKFYE